jgi:hypothetical protein
MTQDGIDCSRWESRIVRSTMVHDPQRVAMLRTQRTLLGCGRPSRYRADSSAARCISAASPRRAPDRAWLASRRVIRSTKSETSRCSSALPSRAGTSTTIVSPSRYAETVRRRRVLRRTSTAGAVDEPDGRASSAMPPP